MNTSWHGGERMYLRGICGWSPRFFKHHSAFLLNLSHLMWSYGNCLPRNTKMLCKFLFSVRRVYIQQCLQVIRDNYSGRPAPSWFSRLKFFIPSFTRRIIYSFSPFAAQIIPVASAAFFFRWNAKRLVYRICSFVIAIVFVVTYIKLQIAWHFRRSAVKTWNWKQTGK